MDASRVGVCQADAFPEQGSVRLPTPPRSKERVTVDASRVGVCQADAFPKQGSVRCRRLLVQRSVKNCGAARRAALATSSAFRGEVCGREDLAPRAPRAGPAPQNRYHADGHR